MDTGAGSRLACLLVLIVAGGCGSSDENARSTSGSTASVAQEVVPAPFTGSQVEEAFAANGEKVTKVGDANDDAVMVGDSGEPLPLAIYTPTYMMGFELDYLIYVYETDVLAQAAEQGATGVNPLDGKPVDYRRVKNVLVMLSPETRRLPALEDSLVDLNQP